MRRGVLEARRKQDACIERLMAVEPVIYGASARPPRGDYSRAGADYTCEQD